MKITIQQERRILQYISDVEARLGSTPEDIRNQALAQLRAAIDGAIQQIPNPVARDEDVEAVFRQYGPPSRQAARILGEYAERLNGFLAWDTRVLLGVCGGLARRFEVPPFAVRGVVLVLGLMLPLLPLVLIVYIGSFLFAYWHESGQEKPRIASAPLVKSLVKTFFIALALHVGSQLVLYFIGWSYAHLTGKPLVLAAQWSMLQREGPSLFWWALLFSMPIMALGGLPVRPGWEGTLRKLSHACLAIYALVLCFGIASVLVGLILSISGEMGVPSNIDTIKSLLKP